MVHVLPSQVHSWQPTLTVWPGCKGGVREPGPVVRGRAQGSLRQGEVAVRSSRAQWRTGMASPRPAPALLQGPGLLGASLGWAPRLEAPQALLGHGVPLPGCALGPWH